MPLTPKQEKFAQVYVKTGNASEAYRQAYDASAMAPETICNNAYQLTIHDDVSARISAMQDHIRRRNEVTTDRVIAELSKLAFHDVRRMFNEDSSLRPIAELDDDIAASVSGIEFEEKFERSLEPGEGFIPGKKKHVGRVHKIRLADKSKNLEMLAKHLGLFESDNKQKREGVADPGVNVLTDDALAKLIALADGKQNNIRDGADMISGENQPDKVKD